MKTKHLLIGLGLLFAAFVIGCGGGNSGIKNVNATQLYTTAGYTVDTVLKSSASSTP